VGDLATGETVNARAVSTLTGPVTSGPGLSRTELIIAAVVGACCCLALLVALGAGAFVLYRRRAASPPAG
jgi:hypothetical protein